MLRSCRWEDFRVYKLRGVQVPGHRVAHLNGVGLVKAKINKIKCVEDKTIYSRSSVTLI